MRAINIINENFISIKTDNVKLLFYENLNYFFSKFDNAYLLILNREYNIDFQTKTLKLLRKISDERFLFEIDKKVDFIETINDLENTFFEFQMWNLFITNKKFALINFDDYKYSEEDVLFFKSLQNDVVWMKGKEISRMAF